MNIGSRIQARRKQLGLSVEDLAEKLNKNRATIYRYESSYIEKLPVTILEDLAKALKVTPAYLMGWEDEVSRKKEDALADIILKARRDENLIELMRELCDLSPEHRQSVKAFLAVLKQQNINNM